MSVPLLRRILAVGVLYSLGKRSDFVLFTLIYRIVSFNNNIGLNGRKGCSFINL